MYYTNYYTVQHSTANLAIQSHSTCPCAAISAEESVLDSEHVLPVTGLLLTQLLTVEDSTVYLGSQIKACTQYNRSYANTAGLL
jgi:hypothetical protein